MRIAILYWTRQKVGGTEAYLESIVAELLKAGHQVAFFHEVNKPKRNEPITLPEEVSVWCVADLGVKSALSALRRWGPDVIYTHCLMNLKLEAETLKIAPAVFFAHAYYGTCISGQKTFRFPKPSTPCHRRLGWQCLVHYYPHRCGGLNPITMVREYRRQLKRLKQLHDYRAIVTHSSYMRDEYIKHGFDPARVYCLSYYAHQRSKSFGKDTEGLLASSSTSPAQPSSDSNRSNGKTATPWHLLFLGRMDRLKGGDVLIDALPHVRESLNGPLYVTFAGDGRMRKVWERQAVHTQALTDGLHMEFTGWVTGKEREALWKDCDLLVVPSVWPEPFGLVGTEAGLRAVPIAAFAVGGISDWLSDGVNGHLAPGDPPTSAGLAEAITRCLRNSETHERLRRGALAMAQEFNVKNHLELLLEVFETALHDN
jgi:glycosyltransferase involved in cell wall biosynthesis